MENEVKPETPESMPTTNEILLQAISCTTSNDLDVELKTSDEYGGSHNEVIIPTSNSDEGVQPLNQKEEPNSFEESFGVTTPEIASTCASTGNTDMAATQLSSSELIAFTDTPCTVEGSKNDNTISGIKATSSTTHSDNLEQVNESEAMEIQQTEIAEPVVISIDNVQDSEKEQEEPEVQFVSDESEVQFVEAVKPTQPPNTNILQTYIINQSKAGGLPKISNVISTSTIQRPLNAGMKTYGNKTVKVAPKPSIATITAVPISGNQIQGGTVVAIPQAKGGPPKKIVILPPPSGQSISPNNVQRCIIRPQSGMQMPQLIFIPSSSATGVPQVQNITTVPALGGAPLVMTSCLRPKVTQAQIRPASVPNLVRPLRIGLAGITGNKIRTATPSGSLVTATVANNSVGSTSICDKCKGPVGAKGNAIIATCALKKKDSQTQTPSQTLRNNNTAPLISAMQQRCKKYNQAAKAFKAKIKRLEGKVDTLQKQVKSGGKPMKTIDNIIKASRPYLSETAHDLFRLLLCADPDKNSTCTRYANCTKDFALSLYCCSKTAYRVCQSVLKLPTPHGLMRKTRTLAEKNAASGAFDEGGEISIHDGEGNVGEEIDEDEELHEVDEIREEEDDDDDDEVHEEDEEEDMEEDSVKNEDEQAVTEVVELMHCEQQVAFDDGQFEIIIPSNTA